MICSQGREGSCWSRNTLHAGTFSLVAVLTPIVCLQPTTANTCAYNYYSRSNHQAIIATTSTSTSAAPKVG